MFQSFEFILHFESFNRCFFQVDNLYYLPYFLSSHPFSSLSQEHLLENFHFTSDFRNLPLFFLLRLCFPICILILTLFVCATHHSVVHCPDVSANSVSLPMVLFLVIFLCFPLLPSTIKFKTCQKIEALLTHRSG